MHGLVERLMLNGLEAPEGGPGFRNARAGADPVSVLFQICGMRPIFWRGDVTGAKWFLRDDNTGAIGATYSAGVSDDIIQNAIPIATNTILIIS